MNLVHVLRDSLDNSLDRADTVLNQFRIFDSAPSVWANSGPSAIMDILLPVSVTQRLDQNLVRDLPKIYTLINSLPSRADVREWSLSIAVLYPIGRGPRDEETYLRLSLDVKAGVKLTFRRGQNYPRVEFVQHGAGEATRAVPYPLIEVVVSSEGETQGKPYDFPIDPYINIMKSDDPWSGGANADADSRRAQLQVGDVKKDLRDKLTRLTDSIRPFDNIPAIEQIWRANGHSAMIDFLLQPAGTTASPWQIAAVDAGKVAMLRHKMNSMSSGSLYITILYPFGRGTGGWASPVRVAGDLKIGYKITWDSSNTLRVIKVGHGPGDTTRPKAIIEAKLEGKGVVQKYDFPLELHMGLIKNLYHPQNRKTIGPAPDDLEKLLDADHTGELYVSALCKEDRKQNSALEEAVLDLLEDKFKGEETNLPKIMNIAVNKGENNTTYVIVALSRLPKRLQEDREGYCFKGELRDGSGIDLTYTGHRSDEGIVWQAEQKAVHHPFPVIFTQAPCVRERRGTPGPAPREAVRPSGRPSAPTSGSTSRYHSPPRDLEEGSSTGRRGRLY